MGFRPPLRQSFGGLKPTLFAFRKRCGCERSDLDLLIDPTPETTLFDIGAIRHELLQLLGVDVDAVTPKAIPERFRSAVLAQAVPV